MIEVDGGGAGWLDGRRVVRWDGEHPTGLGG